MKYDSRLPIFDQNCREYLIHNDAVDYQSISGVGTSNRDVHPFLTDGNAIVRGMPASKGKKTRPAFFALRVVVVEFEKLSRAGEPLSDIVEALAELLVHP